MLHAGVLVLRELRNHGPDLLAIARSDPHVGHDGYPAQSFEPRVSGTGAEQLTPTERAADAKPAFDPVQHLVRTLLDEMRRARRSDDGDLWKAAKKLERIADLDRRIARRGDARSGRPASVTICLACDDTITGVGNDRNRSGYCPACYIAWWRWKTEHGGESDVNHLAFRKHRKLDLAEERSADEEGDVAAIPPEVAGGTLLAEQLRRKGA